VLPADRSTSREGLDFDEATAVDPTQKPAARAIPRQAVIRPQCLIDAGYLLPEDSERILAQSARRWDLLASAPESAAAQ
jgi:hypothetical protein